MTVLIDSPTKMKVKMKTMTGDTLKVMPARTADSLLEERGRVFRLSRPLLRLMYGEYWFRQSRLSMMVIGSFASYTKTKSVKSAV